MKLRAQITQPPTAAHNYSRQSKQISKGLAKLVKEVKLIGQNKFKELHQVRKSSQALDPTEELFDEEVMVSNQHEIGHKAMNWGEPLKNTINFINTKPSLAP